MFCIASKQHDVVSLNTRISDNSTELTSFVVLPSETMGAWAPLDRYSTEKLWDVVGSYLASILLSTTYEYQPTKLPIITAWFSSLNIIVSKPMVEVAGITRVGQGVILQQHWLYPEPTWV